jgi:hypothetical protein
MPKIPQGFQKEDWKEPLTPKMLGSWKRRLVPLYLGPATTTARPAVKGRVAAVRGDGVLLLYSSPPWGMGQSIFQPCQSFNSTKSSTISVFQPNQAQRTINLSPHSSALSIFQSSQAHYQSLNPVKRTINLSIQSRALSIFQSSQEHYPSFNPV